MKNKKLLVLALALVMVFAMTAVAFAADTGTITITVPTEKQAPTKAVTYTVYKVFDATVNADDATKVNYTLCNGDSLSAAMTAAGFSVDAAGNVSFNGTMGATGDPSDTTIKAIAAYVTSADVVATLTAAVGDTSVTTDALPYGYYYITTSTGSAVTIDSNNNNPTVIDKNVIPPVVKSAGTEYDAASQAAIDAVGTSQSFTAQITKTHGATNLVFTDTMTNMSYNGDVVITVSAGTAPTAAQAVVATTTDGFTVTFDNAYIAGLADDTVITLVYSGTITSDALSTNPATNKATLTSGDGNVAESEEVKVYNAKFTVTKQDGDGKALEGAGFVIKNEAGKYYKLAEDKKSISWVDSIDQATEYKSDANGAVPAFTGLGVGTYTLVEKTVPDGYNKAADQTFTIKDGDYTTANLEQKATVTNKAGAELPSTGGIGTTIFMVLGGILMTAAAILFITKKRVGAEK